MTIAEMRQLSPDEELSPEKAAEEVGVVRQTIYNWLRRKGADQLKAEKAGPRKWRIKRRDLIAFLESSEYREGDDPEQGDPVLRKAFLLLIEISQAALNWKRAGILWEATGGRNDLELSQQHYDTFLARRNDLHAALDTLTDQKLSDLRALAERLGYEMQDDTLTLKLVTQDESSATQTAA